MRPLTLSERAHWAAGLGVIAALAVASRFHTLATLNPV
jgi:hypothetical protein